MSAPDATPVPAGGGCEVCGLPQVGSARFCDAHRRAHARRIGDQLAAVRARHAHRLAAHAAAAGEGLTGWEAYFRGERIFAAREAAQESERDDPGQVSS